MGVLSLILFLTILMDAAWGSATRHRPFCTNNVGITGGHKVSIKDVPFIVSINELDPEIEDEYTVFCAGTIIHERFILTAASCFGDDVEGEAKNFTVLVSTQNLEEDGVYANVEEKFCHESYDDENLNNDICLLKLDSNVPFAWLVTAELPDKDFKLRAGTLVNVTGWGATRRDLDMEDELRQVTVPVLSQKCCDDIYEDFRDEQICAGARFRDFCEGDMGGPLTINNVQVGVISGSGECGKNPGYYTRITSYLDWIQSTINKNL